MSSDYTVGYKKPPTNRQYKKGKSGNPHGRPKGSRGLKTDLREELAETIYVTEGGIRKAITKQRAAVKCLIDSVLRGKMGAVSALFKAIPAIVGVEDYRPPEPWERDWVGDALDESQRRLWLIAEGQKQDRADWLEHLANGGKDESCAEPDAENAGGVVEPPLAGDIVDPPEDGAPIHPEAASYPHSKG